MLNWKGKESKTEIDVCATMRWCQNECQDKATQTVQAVMASSQLLNGTQKAPHRAMKWERKRGEERDRIETRGGGVKETCQISRWAHFAVNFAGIST